MSRARIVRVAFVLSLFLLVATTVALAASRNYRTHLSGAYEVPVRDTQAQGQAILQLNEDGTELHYKLMVANIENVLQAHIHLGPPEATGPIVAWLYPSAPPAQLIPGRVQGVLGEGVITEANLVGPLAGQPLSALIEALENNNAYVNVHTTQFPPGEIRGNLP
ncbi:MAG TPA: CHRD domain-containing protein [Caldilineaceae bacterium]|nr:CHRD domain-containing protein [Caldilineaceae bacterium]